MPLASGCQHKDDPQPASYDELALDTGHWEWENTTLGFSPLQTPATIGFTRQLTFKTGGQVVIQHSQKRVKTTDYALSMGALLGCGDAQQPVPIITYEADAEVKVGLGGSRKAYTVSKSGVDQYLFLTYDYACVDGGAYETYHWVKE
ncbi:MAG: hypothetical protein WKG07_46760 [Hymenobacter sp.]